MADRPVYLHPDFKRVAARYRNAIRRRDDAAIDRARADLDRLAHEVAQAEQWRLTAELAFTAPKPNSRRRDMTTWNDAEAEARKPLPNLANILVKLREDGERIELAVVSEPHFYMRRKFEDRTKETKRFLVNVFVPGQGMKVLETTVAAFTSISSLRERISFDKRLVSVERNGRRGDPDTTYRIIAGEAISPELASQIAAASRHDLAQIAERRTADAERGRFVPYAPLIYKAPSLDRRNG